VWASNWPYQAPLAGLTLREHLHCHSCPLPAYFRRLGRLRHRRICLTPRRRLQLRHQRRTYLLFFSSPNRSPLSHTDLIPTSSHKRYHLIWAHLPFSLLSGLFITYTTSDPRPPDTRPLFRAYQRFFSNRSDDSASGRRATI
jgi:hypothetical protein